MLAVVAVFGFLAWLIWEANEQHPIVDLSLFAIRNFSLGTAAYCLAFAVFFGNIVLMPLWLQTQLGYTATWAGLVAAPSGAVSILVSPYIGRLVGKVDSRRIATVGFIAFGLSYFMRAGFTADASFAAFLVVPQLVMGIGMGTFFVAMISILLDGMPPAARALRRRRLQLSLRITASSFATSITTTFWDRHEAFHQTRLAESSSIFTPNLQDALRGLERLRFGRQRSAGSGGHTLPTAHAPGVFAVLARLFLDLRLVGAGAAGTGVVDAPAHWQQRRVAGPNKAPPAGLQALPRKGPPRP